MMILIWGLNVLLNQTGPVWWQWSVGPLTFRLTKTAVLYGGTMALSLGGMILAFVWFNQIMTTPKLSYLLFPVVPRLAMLADHLLTHGAPLYCEVSTIGDASKDT
ncbi:hypothetical protein L3X07_01735 [Levilactobacillus brevis]|nr:hypothetical protein [Levilactobacillus brevis]